jgi:hypothetical protein
MMQWHLAIHFQWASDLSKEHVNTSNIGRSIQIQCLHNVWFSWQYQYTIIEKSEDIDSCVTDTVKQIK